MDEQRVFPLEFTPQCPHLAWLVEHLGGWQFGEEGLIQALMATLGLIKGMCIEYGAGDGVDLPVTIDRICKARPDNCMLIEIDDARRKSLRRLYPVECVYKAICWERDHFADTDLVIIDIDGSDSVVMREMFAAGVRPTLLVVEHMDRHFPIATSNPDPIPTWMLGLKLESGHAIQDTAETLHAIAARNGYERIGMNRCNSFFVVAARYTDLFR